MSPALHDDPDTLAGEYVLGLLDAGAARHVEGLLATDGALKSAVARWRERLQELDDTADVLAPSASVWTGIEASLNAPVPRRPEPAAGSLWRGFWESLPLWRGAGLAGAALSAALLAALIVTPRGASQPIVIAVLLSSDARPGAIVEVFKDARTVIVPLVDIPVPPGRALQVWTLPDPAKGPVSLGLMPGVQRVSLSSEGLPAPRHDQLYEITLEPQSGSPTGRPTGPILFKGLATAPRT